MGAPSHLQDDDSSTDARFDFDVPEQHYAVCQKTDAFFRHAEGLPCQLRSLPAKERAEVLRLEEHHSPINLKPHVFRLNEHAEVGQRVHGYPPGVDLCDGTFEDGLNSFSLDHDIRRCTDDLEFLFPLQCPQVHSDVGGIPVQLVWEFFEGQVDSRLPFLGPLDEVLETERRFPCACAPSNQDRITSHEPTA